MKEQLQTLRKQKGLTQGEISDIIGVKLSTYQKYERDVIFPPYDTLIRIADFYGVTTDYLLGREPAADPLQGLDITVDRVDNDNFIEAYEKLPECVKQVFIDTMLKLSQAGAERAKAENLISIRFYESTRVSAGTGLYDDNSEYPSYKQVPKTTLTQQADFCCYISGDSMQPMYFDGDLILVKSESNIEVGEIGIFEYNGDIYVKQFGGDELISLNPDYPNIKKSPDIHCQGKVLGKIE